MFGMCIRYARTREDAEDILHDGFIAAFRDFHQYKGDGPVEGWVRRVILNTALQFLRKQSKNIFHPEIKANIIKSCRCLMIPLMMILSKKNK
jgi:RNA polymerase sigma factor (sigma-70 family)